MLSSAGLAPLSWERAGRLAEALLSLVPGETRGDNPRPVISALLALERAQVVIGYVWPQLSPEILLRLLPFIPLYLILMLSCLPPLFTSPFSHILTLSLVHPPSFPPSRSLSLPQSLSLCRRGVQIAAGCSGQAGTVSGRPHKGSLL